MNVEKIKRLLLLTIGIMTAIMAYYIWDFNRKKTTPQPIPVPMDTKADVVVNNVELVETLNDRILWILRAQVAEVYNVRKETRGRGVEVDFFDEQGKSLHVISDEGIKDDNTGNIIASGNVQAIAIREGSSLKTDELMYQAEMNKITSEKHVIIERGTTITTGDGLEADLNLSEIRILRNGTTTILLE